MSPDSITAAIKWGLPSTTPGMIISLLGGTTIVSVIDMQWYAGMSVMEWHACTALPTLSVQPSTSKIHIWACRKSRPKSAGASSGAMPILCSMDQISMPIFIHRFTEPRVRKTPPSAIQSSPPGCSISASTIPGIYAKTSGCITLIVESESNKAKTVIPWRSLETCKLPNVSEIK